MDKIHAGNEPPSRRASFAPAAARAAGAAGLIYLVGSLVDLGILWLGQRQAGIQWEFVAITNTVEAWPRLALSIALLYAAAHFAGSRSVLVHRLLAVGLLLMGLGAVVLGALLGLNYMQVSGGLQPESAGMIRSSVLKTEILCGLYVLVLVPVGVLGLIGPKQGS